MLEQDAIDHLVKSPTISLNDFLVLLDFSVRYTDALADAAVAIKMVATREKFWSAFAKAKRTAEIITTLGALPRNPRHLIEMLLDRCQFQIDPSESPPMQWMCPQRGIQWRFEQARLLELAQDINRNVLVPPHKFIDRDISAEVEFKTQQFDEVLRRAIIDRLMRPSEFDWETLVRTVFVQTEVGWEIQSAILKKFVWQVKRKLHGLDVSDHIMPVLVGSQAGGKSTFCERLIAPLGSLSAATNLKAIADDRNAALFRRYVLFIDEMSKASTADIETIKTNITRTHFDYRPMGTNGNVTEINNATMIGTSNKSLGQVLNDPTGNRRFFQLDYRPRDHDADARGETAPHFLYLDKLDWWALWGSVDHLAQDPMHDFRAQITSIQAASRTTSTIEQFALHVVDYEGRYAHGEMSDLRNFPSGRVSSDTFYAAYRDYCDAYRLRNPMEKAGFDLEIGRLFQHQPDFPFTRGLTKGKRTWQYNGPREPDMMSKLITLRRGEAQ